MRNVKLKNKLLKACEDIVDDKITELYEPVVNLIDNKFEDRVIPLSNMIDELIGSNTDDLKEVLKVVECIDSFIGEENRAFNEEIKQGLNDFISDQRLSLFIDEVIDTLCAGLITKCFMFNNHLIHKEVMMFRRKCATKLNTFINLIITDTNEKFYVNLIDKVMSLVLYAQHLLGADDFEEFKRLITQCEEEEEIGEVEVEKYRKKKLFTSRELDKFLRQQGFEKHRQGATSHGVYVNEETNKKVVLPQGRSIGKGLSYAIQKQAIV